MAYDIIVCGAGPAGVTCALYLARKNFKVLLLEKEKFPRDKVCADNKTWLCLDIIKELGLWNEFEKLPKKEIIGVSVTSPSGHEIYTPLLKEDIEEKGPWHNVRRILFDAMFANACRREKNITFRENCEVITPIIEDEIVRGIIFKNESGKKENVYAKVIVAADGSKSPVAKALGLSAKVEGRYAFNARAYFENVAQTKNVCELYYLEGICPGYFWIFPVDNNACNVGIGMCKEDIQAQGINLEKKLMEIVSSGKFSKRFEKARQISEIKEWGLSVLGGKRKCSGNGFVLCGDAGTFAMTFSGEGVGPAMRSGKIAAKAITSAFEKNDFSANTLNKYDELMWNILDKEVSGFKWLEFLILHPKIFDFVVAQSAKKPELVKISSRMQRDYSVAKELVNPVTLLKLLF